MRIAKVGKYTGLSDSYLSVIKVKLDALNPWSRLTYMYMYTNTHIHIIFYSYFFFSKKRLIYIFFIHLFSIPQNTLFSIIYLFFISSPRWSIFLNCPRNSLVTVRVQPIISFNIRWVSSSPFFYGFLHLHSLFFLFNHFITILVLLMPIKKRKEKKNKNKTTLWLNFLLVLLSRKSIPPLRNEFYDLPETSSFPPCRCYWAA